MNTRNLVRLASYRTRFEAEADASMLAAEDIPYLIQGHDISGAFPGASGGAELLVREEDLERAWESITGFETADG